MDELSHQAETLINTIMANPGKSNTEIYAMCELALSTGKDLLKSLPVQTELKKRQAAAAYDCQINLRRVMLEESCVAFLDPIDLFDKEGSIVAPHELPERIRRAIASVEVKELKSDGDGEKRYKYKYKFWDKGKSLERISKHLGLYEKDNVQKAVRMYFIRSDDVDAPQIEDSPEVVEGEFREIDNKKPVALLE